METISPCVCRGDRGGGAICRGILTNRLTASSQACFASSTYSSPQPTHQHNKIQSTFFMLIKLSVLGRSIHIRIFPWTFTLARDPSRSPHPPPPPQQIHDHGVLQLIQIAQVCKRAEGDVSCEMRWASFIFFTLCVWWLLLANSIHEEDTVLLASRRSWYFMLLKVIRVEMPKTCFFDELFLLLSLTQWGTRAWKCITPILYYILSR